MNEFVGLMPRLRLGHDPCSHERESFAGLDAVSQLRSGVLLRRRATGPVQKTKPATTALRSNGRRHGHCTGHGAQQLRGWHPVAKRESSGRPTLLRVAAWGELKRTNQHSGPFTEHKLPTSVLRRLGDRGRPGWLASSASGAPHLNHGCLRLKAVRAPRPNPIAHGAPCGKRAAGIH